MNVYEKLISGLPMKVLAYGFGKTRKTSWAGQVAKTNLNGIYCDCDNSVAVLGSSLTPDEAKKLIYVDISDNINEAKASWFLGALAKGKPFIWDQANKKILRAYQPNLDLLLVNPKLFTPSDVIIIDSWTQVCNSLFIQYALENGIDLSEAKKLEWDDYRWAGSLATFLLTSLMALPCSIILISHVKTYEKKLKDKYGKEQIISVRTQPTSVSSNHAETISKFFGEVYYFYKLGTGSKISTKTSDSLDCGSRFLEPKDWNYDELTLEFIANKYQINKPTELKAIKQFPASGTAEEFTSLWNEMTGKTSEANEAKPSVAKPSGTSVAKPTATSSSPAKPRFLKPLSLK